MSNVDSRCRVRRRTTARRLPLVRMGVLCIGLGWCIGLGGLFGGPGVSGASAEQIMAGLPSVLDPDDRARYGRIFALQEAGELSQAAAEIARLRNPILLGYVQAQKYLHPTAYRSRYDELARWLSHYADHPDASRIHALALKRRPKGAAQPQRPTADQPGPLGIDESEPAIDLPSRALSDADRTRLRTLQRRMRQRIRRGWPTGAKEILATAEHRGLATDAEYDAYATRIAWSYYLHDKDAEAFALAAASASRSQRYLPHADWTAALAAWRLGRMDDARRHFEALGGSQTAWRWLRAAGAYWAARANLRLGRPERVSAWLERAIESPRTFYGLLAYRALGYAPPLDWSQPALTTEECRAVEQVSGILRAVALAEVGRRRQAEEEIRRLYGRTPAPGIKALLALATQLDLPAAQMGLARRSEDVSGAASDLGAYPMPDWEPDGGFTVDRALIFGIIRQESGFRADARSSQGARGVMQLMPRTARFAARRAGLDGLPRAALSQPGVNIAIGQSYVDHLLGLNAVSGNLFFLLAAYNGGPGNLAKWRGKTNFGDDPLLFIESIRSRETRFFIERVLTNFWIYRMRLGQDTPSLDDAASGRWPSYVPQDP